MKATDGGHGGNGSVVYENVRFAFGGGAEQARGELHAVLLHAIDKET